MFFLSNVEWCHCLILSSKYVYICHQLSTFFLIRNHLSTTNMVWVFRRRKRNHMTDKSDELPFRPTSSTTKILYFLISLNFAILAVVVLGGAMLRNKSQIAGTIDPTPSAPNMPIPITHCGNTPAEARALGCIFESNNLAWVPPQCYDRELGDEWDAKQWLYAYGDNKEIVRQDLVLEGDFDYVFVTWGQHVAHCALMVRKFQRAVFHNWPMDNWTSSIAHTDHCAGSFVEWKYMKAPDEMNAKVSLKYPVCDYRWQEGFSTR
jgi:hypothetical protein